jgi:hypothetical protein
MGVFTDTAPFRKHQDAWALGAGIVPDGKALTKVAVVLVFDDRRVLHLASRIANSVHKNSAARRKQCQSQAGNNPKTVSGPIGGSIDGDPLVGTVSLRLDGTIPGYWTIRKASVDGTLSQYDGVSSCSKPLAFAKP